MINMKREVPLSKNKKKEFTVRLMSDLHVDSAESDHELIKHELAESKARGDRINIAGDLFDLILPSDKKRYRPSAVHPSLAGRDNYVSGAGDLAFEILEPYANIIDVIGIGNHEDSVLKHHSENIILSLVKRLNATSKEANVHYGGFSGWIGYSFKEGKKFIDSLKIQYFHGSGGAAPVSKGMIDFNRHDVWIEGADVIWRGHKHNKVYYKDRAMHYRKDCSGFDTRSRLHLLTGAYDKDYSEESQDAIMNTGGHEAHYAKDRLMAPQGQGSFVISVQFEKGDKKSGLKKRIRVIDDEVSDVV